MRLERRKKEKKKFVSTHIEKTTQLFLKLVSTEVAVASAARGRERGSLTSAGVEVFDSVRTHYRLRARFDVLPDFRDLDGRRLVYVLWTQPPAEAARARRGLPHRERGHQRAHAAAAARLRGARGAAERPRVGVLPLDAQGRHGGGAHVPFK